MTTNKRFLLLFGFAIFLVSLTAISAFAVDPTRELNSEVINHQSKVDKKDLPKGILVKRDAEGNISIYQSKTELDAEKIIAAKDFEKFAYQPIGKARNATDELNQDKPRQSWYVWYSPYIYYGFAFAAYAYNYYYPAPLYYYGYNYYPYYNYAWNNCNYYWYRYY